MEVQKVTLYTQKRETGFQTRYLLSDDVVDDKILEPLIHEDNFDHLAYHAVNEGHLKPPFLINTLDSPRIYSERDDYFDSVPLKDLLRFKKRVMVLLGDYSLSDTSPEGE